MINLKKFIALGLMSGTSADGIDIGVIKTDGKSKINLGPSDYYPYSPSFKKRIKSIFKKKRDLRKSIPLGFLVNNLI